MKKYIGFAAGAVFALALIITCGGGGSGPTTDAGSVRGSFDTGSIGSLIPRDSWVGEARAQTPSSATWEYAVVLVPNNYQPVTFGGPAGTSLDCSTCNPADALCCANLAGAQGWELSAIVGSSANLMNLYFKRPKP
jgi:hypothetical protein